MRAPGFWRGPRPGWQAACLWPPSLVYAAVATARFRRQPSARAGVPVVCIGNPTVGGSGKTPTAILIARLLATLGRKPVFLSRGYGARVSHPLKVDLQKHTADEVGDEPLLLAKTAPTVVSPDRVAGAHVAESLGDVIVMDDGFQNPALAKDVSLLVVDAEYGVGNGYCLPAGPLRLPLGEQLNRVHAVLVIGEGEAGDRIAERAEGQGLAVLRGQLAAGPAMAAALASRPVLAFAGIGRPEKFFRTLASIGAQIVETRTFADHHMYSESDARGLMALQRRSGAIPVTTEKDAARIGSPTDGLLKALADAMVGLPVSLALDEASATRCHDLLLEALKKS
jgi:tetraacyldisaccharide 4'-kinase